MLRYVLLFLCVLAAVSVYPVEAARPSTSPADQSVPVNFTILPGTQPQGHAVTRAFSFTLPRGRSVRDTVLIVNPSKTAALTVRLSVSDAMTRPQGGGPVFNDAAQQQRIGRWIHLAASTVTVPPYHLSYVPLTLSIPSSVRPGDYEGAVNATDVQPQSMQAGKLHVRVYLNRRCIVLLRVLGGATVGMRVDRAGVVPGGAHGVVSFALRNTGSVFAYPAAITITFAGKRPYTVHGAAGMVMGGDSTTLAYPLAQALPAGIYTVHIDVWYSATPSGATAQQLHTAWTGRLRIPQGMGGE